MRELLPLLPKPSRYIGTEEGAIRKDPGRVSLRVGLAFPDLYEIGMSYLGQKILYGIVNKNPDWWAERVFSPCREASAILREKNVPLATLEGDLPLARLDFLGFHLTHELSWTNVLNMLELGGIPLRAADRTRGDALGPVIAAGGGCALSSEPMAPFFDLMLLGDGEDALPRLLRTLEEAKRQGLSRSAFLRRAARLPGVYVPEFFAPSPVGLRPVFPDLPLPARQAVADLDAAPYPVAQIVPFGAVHNRLALEIARGCTRGCRFCQAGMLYRPARERSVSVLERIVEESLAGTGYEDLSFLSLSCGDFSALKQLFLRATEQCAREQVSVSLPSLRVGSIDDDIMAKVASIRRTGATLAPEAGTQRLRDVINKGVTEEELLIHIRKLFEHGWRQVKLYFMIGLPTETDDDLRGIVELCRKARDAAGKNRMQIGAAVSPFVPKAHTPFQWEGQPPLEEITRRIFFLRDLFRREKNIRMRWHEPAMSVLEGLLSRGDRRLSQVVESAFRKGALFDSWLEEFSFAPWEAALAENGIGFAQYAGPRSTDVPLPWDHLDSGVSRAFLLRERARALAGRTSGDCRYGSCAGCGVCDPQALSRRDPPPPGVLGNRLNFPERDQKAHGPGQDKKEPRPAPPGRPAPSGVAEELAAREAQYRFWYAKKDEAVFLSQLELQSVFERAMRRAGLKLAFSRGFHPLPLITFSRALPVGVASVAEWFSVILRHRPPLDALLVPLRNAMPRGIEILAGEEITPVRKHLPQAVRESWLLECLCPEKFNFFAKAWNTFANLVTFPWKRATKKGERTLDARPLVASMEWQGTGIRLVFDWSEIYVSPLALCLTVCPGISPAEIRLTKLDQQFAAPKNSIHL